MVATPPKTRKGPVTGIEYKTLYTELINISYVHKARRGEIPQTTCYPCNKEGEIILRRSLRRRSAEGRLRRRLPPSVEVSALVSVDSIDWGERSSQPILKMDEPVCLKFSRRNFKILRARLEQETAENYFCRLPEDSFIVRGHNKKV